MIDRPEDLRPGLRIPLLFSLLTLAVYSLTRIGLALWTGMAAVPLSLWPAMLAQGLWFDLAALTALLAPVLVYEAVVAPGEFTATMSQIDLPPTILDVLRAEGDGVFGRSMFRQPATASRAFISNYQELGYLKDGVLTVLSLNRKIEAFRVDPATFESVRIPVDRTLADEAVAYYQTASRSFRQGALKEVAAAPRAVTARHPP